MVQFISHYTEKYSYLDSIAMALEGGCRWIQLRMKQATTGEMLPLAEKAQKMCRDVGAAFIIDDNVELVGMIHADGVHLGKRDMPVAEARELLGDNYIIGGTANTLQDIQALRAAGADYVGCGPFRFTTTKMGLSPIIGLEGYRRMMGQLHSEEDGEDMKKPCPVVAIGGITAADIPDLMETGVDGIALCGAVLKAPDPVAEMRKIVELTNKAKSDKI